MRKTLLFCAALLLCAPASAQDNSEDLTLLFESQPGTRPTQIFTDGFESGNVSRFDMNGDGTTDLILQRDNEEGYLQDLLVRDGRTHEVLWMVQDVQVLFGITSNMDIWGFTDPDADGEREALFVLEDNEGLILVNPDDNTLSWNFLNGWPSRLVGVSDLTDDGSEDLIILRIDTRQLQIWGDPHVDES